MLKELIRIIKNGNIVVLTGAGISTKSGIPDFRSEDGLYQKYGEKIFDLQFFFENPSAFYDFVCKEFPKMYDAKPNFAHMFLAKLEKNGYINGIITQNIDNLHYKAGSKNVLELHGNATRFYCTRCGKQSKNIFDGYICECGGLIRPDIVFFSESVRYLEESYALIDNSSTLIVVGSSLQVYPAAYLPIYAKKQNKTLVIINKGKTPLDDYADIIIYDDIVETFEKIAKYFEEVVD
jgi:NAD-dependent deacetylase